MIVTGGTISAVEQGNIVAEGALEIDAKGHYIAPGLSIYMYMEVGVMILWMAVKLLS